MSVRITSTSTSKPKMGVPVRLKSVTEEVKLKSELKIFILISTLSTFASQNPSVLMINVDD